MKIELYNYGRTTCIAAEILQSGKMGWLNLKTAVDDDEEPQGVI